MKNLIKAGLSITAFLLAFITCGPLLISAQVHYSDIIPDIVVSSPNYLCAGQHDEAYIHYVDIEPDTVIDTPWDYGLYYDFDLNGDDTLDYQFYCHSGGGVGFGGSSSSVKGLNENKKVITTKEHPDWIKKLDYGDSITFMDEEIPSEYCIYCSYFYSEWENISSGYWWGEDPDNYTGLIMFQGGDTIMAWVKLSAGHLITSSRLTLVSNEPATVDPGTLRQGIYVLKVMFEEETISRKITVIR